MFFRDLLVASVAFGLAFSILQVAWTNKGWCFESFLIRHIESKHGRAAARKAMGLAGSALIMIGVWTLVSPVVLGDSEDSSNRSNSAPILENR